MTLLALNDRALVAVLGKKTLQKRDLITRKKLFLLELISCFKELTLEEGCKKDGTELLPLKVYPFT